MSKFVWHDLMTRDVESAKTFYADLLGWTYEIFMPGVADYPMISAAGTMYGGIMALPEGAQAPPSWIGYIGVDSADAACERAAAAGAKVHVEPRDIPTVGRFAILLDPQGAAFAVFAPSGEAPAGPAEAPVGGVVWDELLTTDVVGALAFYTGTFGWTSRGMDMGEMGVYNILESDGEDIGGAFRLPDQAAAMGAPPHWVVYFRSADAVATTAKAKELGATVLYDVMEVPNVGSIACFKDPQGAIFAIIQPSM